MSDMMAVWLGKASFTTPAAGSTRPCSFEGCYSPRRPCECGPHTSANPHKYTNAALAIHMMTRHKEGDKNKGASSGPANKRRRVDPEDVGAAVELPAAAVPRDDSEPAPPRGVDGAAAPVDEPPSGKVRKPRYKWTAAQRLVILNRWRQLKAAKMAGAMHLMQGGALMRRLNEDISMMDGCKGRTINNETQLFGWKNREAKDRKLVAEGHGDGARSTFSKARHPEIDARLDARFQEERSMGFAVLNTHLRAFAVEIADELQVSGFSGSDGYLARFKKRNKISRQRIQNIKPLSADARRDTCLKFLQGLVLLCRKEIAMQPEEESIDNEDDDEGAAGGAGGAGGGAGGADSAAGGAGGAVVDGLEPSVLFAKQVLEARAEMTESERSESP